MPVLRSISGQSPFALLIAASLLLKALIPVGWMPAFEDGSVALRPCGGWMVTQSAPAAPAAHDQHGDAHHHASAPPSHHDGDDQEQQGQDQPCAFAATGLSWTTPEPPTSLPPFTEGTVLASGRAQAGAIGRGLAAPPPPATGPPFLL